MVSFMKHPRNHRVLESDLVTLHVTRLGPKNVHKMGQIEGLKDMNGAGPKPCINRRIGFSDLWYSSKI
jgi:hypothetical protein